MITGRYVLEQARLSTMAISNPRCSVLLAIFDKNQSIIDDEHQAMGYGMFEDKKMDWRFAWQAQGLIQVEPLLTLSP